MENIAKQLLEKYFSEIKKLDEMTIEKIDKTRKAILVIHHVLLELKVYIYGYNFKDIIQNIHFHKEIVPNFVAEYIFHVQVLKLETTVARMAEEPCKKMLEKEKRDINRFFEKNTALLQYLAGGNTYLDEKYFLNEGTQLEFSFLDESTTILESRFITSTGYTIARLNAYERLLHHIESILVETNISNRKESTTKKMTNPSSLQWTESNISLTEISYALKYAGAVNNGKVDIKEIVEILAKAFNVKPGNIYRNKQDLYSRRNQGMFLDRLRKELVRGLEDSDDHYK
jgi:RteC protein.